MNYVNQAERTEYLDRCLPLKGASHRDVVHYSVDIPMRYSECAAKLRDGRTVRLRNSRQFIGWTGMNGSRVLLFESDSGRVMIPSRPDARPEPPPEESGVRRFIKRDGDLIFVRGVESFA